MKEKKLKVFKYTDGKMTKYFFMVNENIPECKERSIGYILDLGEGQVHGGSRLIRGKIKHHSNIKEVTEYVEGGITDYFFKKYGVEIDIVKVEYQRSTNSYTISVNDLDKFSNEEIIKIQKEGYSITFVDDSIVKRNLTQN